MSDFPASTTVTSPAAHPTSEKVNESESKISSLTHKMTNKIVASIKLCIIWKILLSFYTTVTSPATHSTSEKVNESESKIHSQYYHRLVPFTCHFFYEILNLENVHQKVAQLKFATILLLLCYSLQKIHQRENERESKI